MKNMFVMLLMMFATCVSAQQVFFLDVNVKGNGSVNRNPVDSLGYYEDGTDVQLIAIPASLWQFQKWVSGATTVTNDTVTVSMTQDREITAFFIKGKRLFVTDKILEASRILGKVRSAFEDLNEVIDTEKEIVIGDTTIIVNYETLTSGDKQLFVNKLILEIGRAETALDTVKGAIQSQ
jgi:predicted ester cyclase